MLRRDFPYLARKIEGSAGRFKVRGLAEQLVDVRMQPHKIDFARYFDRKKTPVARGFCKRFVVVGRAAKNIPARALRY